MRGGNIMTKNTESIMIFTSDESVIPPHEISRGLSDVMKSIGAKTSEVAVSTLQENMSSFLENLDIVISASPKDIGGLILDEIEIFAQIDSKGNVGISGIAGMELATQSGIKFVLRKKV